MTEALFVPDAADVFAPTDLCRGPWSPDAQHGGPPCALVARAVERVDAPVPMAVARLTFELLRPVPLAPLTVSTEVLRPGKKVQLVGASLRTVDGDVEVLRAVALRIRRDERALPEPLAAGGGDGVPALPSSAEEATRPPFATVDEELRFFHRDGMEIRVVAGGFDRPGPATGWFRLRVPVVAGEEPTGVVRAVAAADFGNGISWVLPPDWLFINPDLTVHLLREPVGEWVCLAARTLPSGAGTGLAESALYDAEGRVGRSVQSLLLDAR